MSHRSTYRAKKKLMELPEEHILTWGEAPWAAERRPGRSKGPPTGAIGIPMGHFCELKMAKSMILLCKIDVFQ